MHSLGLRPHQSGLYGAKYHYRKLECCLAPESLKAIMRRLTDEKVVVSFTNMGIAKNVVTSRCCTDLGAVGLGGTRERV
jgi:hypothetical protein